MAHQHPIGNEYDVRTYLGEYAVSSLPENKRGKQNYSDFDRDEMRDSLLQIEAHDRVIFRSHLFPVN